MKVLLLFAAALTLSACASTSAYGPKGSDGNGFTTRKVEQDRFRVSYTSPNEEQARDFALVRAAEVTLENGSEWFRVVGENASGHRDGLAGARTAIGNRVIGQMPRRTAFGNPTASFIAVAVGQAMNNAKHAQNQPVTLSLEILTGNGVIPEGADTYSAEQVVQNLRTENET